MYVYNIALTLRIFLHLHTERNMNETHTTKAKAILGSVILLYAMESSKNWHKRELCACAVHRIYGLEVVFSLYISYYYIISTFLRQLERITSKNVSITYFIIKNSRHERHAARIINMQKSWNKKECTKEHTGLMIP